MNNSEDKKTNDIDNLSQGVSPIRTADFMREKIKQRPINKKKLLRRTLITVTMAVVFGAVACLTFVFLSPLINNKLYPEEKPTPVALTAEETVTDEMQPEDMYADDSAIAAEAASAAIDMASNELNRMQKEMTTHSVDVSDFKSMYTSLRDVANDSAKSIVKVTALSSDTNWINNPYESEGSVSGIIVAENGQEYLILVKSAALNDAQEILVSFVDDSSNYAHLKMSDTNSGFSIIAVQEKDVSDETKNRIKVANLGTSNSGTVTGNPVIAIGSPTGIQGSINYGFVTAGNAALDLPDTSYKLLYTDIYAGSNASGAIVDLTGAVIGVIDMSHNDSNLPNVLCAVGISEMRSLIEDLSNGTGRSYLGLHGQDVPEEIRKTQEIPEGAYITRTEMDSPSMLAGIQSGDIITRINGETVMSYGRLVLELIKLHPGADIKLTAMRQATDGYVELDMEMTIADSAVGKDK